MGQKSREKRQRREIKQAEDAVTQAFNKRIWMPLVEESDKRHVSEDGMYEYSLWGNNHYTVGLEITHSTVEGNPDLIHISIHDHERSTRHDWRDFQFIKNELVGPEQEFMEIYPAESRLVDTANEYHLWGFRGVKITDSVGMRERLVTENPPAKGAVQRPFADYLRPEDLMDEDKIKAVLAEVTSKTLPPSVKRMLEQRQILQTMEIKKKEGDKDADV